MSLRQVSFLWLLAVGLQLGCITAWSQSQAPTTPAADSNAVQELQKAQMEALKELQQKDVEALRAQIAAVDKRVDDWNTHVGQAVDRFGILVTVLLAILGLLGYFTVIRRTKAEAQEAAEQWFEQKAAALEAQLQEVERKALEVIQSVERKALEAIQNMDAEVQRVSTRREVAEKSIDALVAPAFQDINAVSTPENQAAVAMILERAEEVKKNLEDSVSFNDWNTRAFAAYQNNQPEEAALYWKKAALMPNAGALNVAKVLFNRGLALRQLHQNEAAIASYEDLLRQFGEANDPAMRHEVIKAMYNKGVRLGVLERREKAIAAYGDLLHRFGQVTDSTIRMQVIKAMINKGVLQGEMNNKDGWESAIATYEELLSQFDRSIEIPFREPVAKAMLNKGSAQGYLGQGEAAIATYDDLLIRFGQASEPTLRELVAKALINKSVTQAKLGRSEAAIATSDELLRRFGDAAEPALRELVAHALNSKGFAQLISGKAFWAPGPEHARLQWQEALGHFDQALAKFGINEIEWCDHGQSRLRLGSAGRLRCGRDRVCPSFACSCPWRKSTVRRNPVGF